MGKFMSVFIVEVREKGNKGSMIFPDVVAGSEKEACAQIAEFYYSLSDDKPELTATVTLVSDTKDMH